MKRTILSVLLAVILISLSACGSEAPAPVQTSEPTAAPPAPSAVSTLPGSNLQTSAPQDSSEPASAVDEAKLEAARACIKEDVSTLFDAIGEPMDSSYAPSCLGPGEDGELYYEGFTVATYREGEKEIVWDVNINAG